MSCENALAMTREASLRNLANSKGMLVVANFETKIVALEHSDHVSGIVAFHMSPLILVTTSNIS